VRVDKRSQVAVEVLRGTRVLARATRTLPATSTRTLVVRAVGLARGSRYRIRVRVTSGRSRATTTLFATRL
jgi:hypothetical protein